MKAVKHINLGVLKQWQARLATYASMIQFGMVFYLFIIENRWFSWHIWLLIISVSVLALVWFDTVKVMPAQLEYGFKKNPEWQRHVKRQDLILKQQEMILRYLEDS